MNFTKASKRMSNCIITRSCCRCRVDARFQLQASLRSLQPVRLFVLFGVGVLMVWRVQEPGPVVVGGGGGDCSEAVGSRDGGSNAQDGTTSAGEWKLRLSFSCLVLTSPSLSQGFRVCAKVPIANMNCCGSTAGGNKLLSTPFPKKAECHPTPSTLKRMPNHPGSGPLASKKQTSAGGLSIGAADASSADRPISARRLKSPQAQGICDPRRACCSQGRGGACPMKGRTRRPLVAPAHIDQNGTKIDPCSEHVADSRRPQNQTAVRRSSAKLHVQRPTAPERNEHLRSQDPPTALSSWNTCG